MNKTPNTMDVSFMYFDKSQGLLVTKKKSYTFHIPKALRDEMNLDARHAVIRQAGDNKIQIVEINRIYRENIEATGRKYRTISDFQEVVL